MQRSSQTNHLSQKERARREIERQVEAFLTSGGRISVVDTYQLQQTAALLGTAWREYDEGIELLN
ncbi:hypothetical protein Q6D67_15285 [Haliea sp. E1-2-M8]|uniref:hypothetical protein n=1 Tax=Haliea sp. E1-2-M8 TaxID=3064706 RepID=UPI00271976C4|nr:hypothetical protein [Haliea sp. E1-2-M8]MDO8863070.1 hypothetical protein [Haliea sp. E1-2-M8]